MNELMMNSSDEIRISSLEIAEITGKRHDNILRDCRDQDLIYQQLGALRIEESYYFTSQKKKQLMYLLTKDQALDVLMRYDAVLRTRVRMRFSELERERIQQPTKIPTLEESLEMSLKLVRENKALQEQNEEQDSIIMEMAEQSSKKDEALVDMNNELSEYHHLFKGSRLLDTQAVADLLNIKGLGRNNMRAMLVKDGIFLKKATGEILPMRSQIEAGRFRMIPSNIPHLDEVVNVLKVTEKGFIFLVKHFAAKGLEKIDGSIK